METIHLYIVESIIFEHLHINKKPPASELLLVGYFVRW